MRHLPNFITLLNLLCGCAAVICIFNGNLDQAGLLVLTALVFDFLDGFVARLMKSFSDLGKQLDSLADMITFGLVPGMMMYHLFSHSYPGGGSLVFISGCYFMFIITMFSALRLANFNIDPKQTSYFIGLPTPANTLLIISLPFIVENDQFGIGNFIMNPVTLCVIAIVSSFLLVAKIPLIALKFKSFQLKSNKPQFILLAFALISIITLKYLAAPVIILFYIILSLIYPPDKTTNA